MAANQYECHITLDPGQAGPAMEQLAAKHGFKTSVIVGDELYGPVAKKLYLTSHDTSYHSLGIRMHAAYDDLLSANVPVLRRKIEYIMLDERF